MTLHGAEYFHTLAVLSMAYVGFTAIVVVLHQDTRKKLSPLHFLITCLFVELGLMATAFAMLAPTLAICGLSEELVWKVSSAIMLIILVPWLAMYPVRRKRAAPKEPLPLRWYVMTILGAISIVALLLNLTGLAFPPGPAPLAITTVYILSYASVAFIRTYSLFVRG